MNDKENKISSPPQVSAATSQMKNDAPIGGYFELELSGGNKSLYHDNLIRLNYGRSALEYIVRAKGYKKLYIPYYTCDAILQPLIRLNVKYEFYRINPAFEPQVSPPEPHSALLFVNYFGLMDYKLSGLKEKFQELIVDNSMAFFSRPLQSIPCFYSPRKFFGVPDGGFAYVDNNTMNLNNENDTSYNRVSHLLKRMDLGAEEGFKDFKKNEAASDFSPLLGMSNLTQSILRSINYQSVIAKRNRNFNYLHTHLKTLNEYTNLIARTTVHGPMVYPFLHKNNTLLRKKLIENKIFVAQYWPNITRWLKDPDLMELYLYHNLIPLPIDQRYETKHMDRILQVIHSC